MNLIRQDYGDRLKSFSNGSIDKNDALFLGKVFSILPFQVQRVIIENKDHFGLDGKVPLMRDDNGLIVANTKHIDDIRLKWINNPLLKPLPSYKEATNEGKFIWNFDTYLSTLTIGSIDNVRELYYKICYFVKKYIMFMWQHHSKDDYETISRFLLESILEPCVRTCMLLYKYMGSKEEYTLTESFFNYFFKLLEYTRFCKPMDSNDFAYVLSSLYELYNFDVDLIRGSSDAADPFVLLFIHGRNGDKKNENAEIKAKDVTLALHLYKTGFVQKVSENAICTPFFENTSDIEIFTPEFSGKSESDITVFGDSGIFRSLTGNMEKLKSDLLRFNSDSVKSYIDKGDNVKVNFVIDDQFKMYIQAELDCKILIANIKNNNENNMLTILNYENDNFVLFTVSDDLDTLYGLSINEDLSTKERKLITIDRDEDLTFQFVDNLDE